MTTLSFLSTSQLTAPCLFLPEEEREFFYSSLVRKFEEVGIPKYTRSEFLEDTGSSMLYWEYEKDGEQKFISFLVNSKGNAYYAVSKTIRSQIKTLDEAIEAFANDFHRA